MRSVLLLCLAAIACSSPPSKNPWPDTWTEEKARTWALACPGTKVVREDRHDDYVAVVTGREPGPAGSASPSGLACAAALDKAKGLLLFAEIELRKNRSFEHELATEVPGLLEHVLTVAPRDLHDTIRKVAAGRYPDDEVYVGRFRVTGGLDAAGTFWSLGVDLVKP
jgi:hypothetical protein